MKVYVIEGSYGEYDDYTSWIEPTAYLTENRAEEEIKALLDEKESNKNRYDKNYYVVLHLEVEVQDDNS